MSLHNGCRMLDVGGYTIQLKRSTFSPFLFNGLHSSPDHALLPPEVN